MSGFDELFDFVVVGSGQACGRPGGADGLKG